MAKIKATLNTEQLRKLLKEFPEALTKTFAESMGKEIADEMRSMISKGISPIEGRGRFPEYKAVAAAKALKKTAAKGKLGKQTRTQAKQLEKQGYPRTVQKQFPDKKLRPVNLKLSGEFLSNLKSKTINIREKFQVNVGFFSSKWVKYETGHREGVNGQPSRPIIPQNDEKLAKRIQLKIREMFKNQLNRHFKRK